MVSYDKMASIFSELLPSIPTFIEAMNDLSEKMPYFQNAQIENMYTYIQQDLASMSTTMSDFKDLLHNMGVDEVRLFGAVNHRY